MTIHQGSCHCGAVAFEVEGEIDSGLACIHPFGEGIDPKGRAMVAVNLRCLPEPDLSQGPVHHYDGRAA